MIDAMWRWMLRHGEEHPWWDEWIAYRVLYGRHAAFGRPMAIPDKRRRVRFGRYSG